MVAGNEMDMQSTLLPQKSAKGFPAGLGFLVFVLLLLLTFGLIANYLASLSSEVALGISFIVGFAGGTATYRHTTKLARRHRAREAKERQRHRTAETEKQIAEMKRKAAKAEGTK